MKRLEYDKNSFVPNLDYYNKRHKKQEERQLKSFLKHVKKAVRGKKIGIEKECEKY